MDKLYSKVVVPLYILSETEGFSFSISSPILIVFFIIAILMVPSGILLDFYFPND